MNFFLYFLRNNRPYNRFAVSVSRKIGISVQRNYIKRKMKELFRLNQHFLDENYDLWVLLKKRFGRGDAARVETIFIDALLKINNK